MPAALVNAIDEVLNDNPDLLFDMDLTPADTVSSVRSPIRLEQAPAGHRLPPPGLGEHTEEVLRAGAGYSEDKIAMLRREGAILQNQAAGSSDGGTSLQAKSEGAGMINARRVSALRFRQ